MEDPIDVTADRILRELLMGGRSASNSTITVHNEGRGTWIAVTACLMMLSAMMVAGFWLSREFSNIDAQFGKVDSKFSDVKNTDDIHDAYIQKLRAQQQEKK